MRAYAALAAIAALLLLSSCLPINDLPTSPAKPGQRAYEGTAGAATSYEGYAEAADYWFNGESPFKLMNDAFSIEPDMTSILLDVVVDTHSTSGVAYKTGYYWDGAQWQEFELEGQAISGTGWLKGGGTASLSIPLEDLPEGENYIVTYPCERVAGEWKCGCQGASGPCGFWTLHTFTIEKHSCPSVPIPVCEENHTLTTSVDEESGCVTAYTCEPELPGEPCPPAPFCEEGASTVVDQADGCDVYSCCPLGATAPCSEEQKNEGYSDLNTAALGECPRYRCCAPISMPLCVEGYEIYNPGPDANGCPQSSTCVQSGQPPCPLYACEASILSCKSNETHVSVQTYNDDGCAMCPEEKCVATLNPFLVAGNSPNTDPANDFLFVEEDVFNEFWPNRLISCGNSCGNVNFNIDWSAQNVIVSLMGQQNTGGFSIKHTQLIDVGSALAVLVEEKRPSEGDAVAQTITSPVVASKIPRLDKPVAFVHSPSGKVYILVAASDDHLVRIVPLDSINGQTAAQNACEAYDGIWAQGQTGDYFCNLPAPDAGDACDESKDCSSGICKHAGDHGECFDHMHLNGCVTVWTGNPNTAASMCT